MRLKSIAFTGASNVAAGFLNPADRNSHWVNMVHSLPNFVDFELINAGIPGGTNAETFAKTIDVITNTPSLKYIFCSWVSVTRMRFSLGFELYETVESLDRTDGLTIDRGFNGIVVPRNYLNDLKNRLLALHHLHFEICKVVQYVNIINRLCERFNITVYHINDSCPWDLNYFNRLDNVLPEAYTTFTKTDIIDIKNRNDKDILKLYTQAHDDYDRLGGINESSWINLYSSFLDNQTDYSHDNTHPGPASNTAYFQTIKSFLESKSSPLIKN